MSSAVSLPNYPSSGQASSSKRETSTVLILLPKTDNCPSWISGRENDRRKYFMINLQERMLPTRGGRILKLLIISRTRIQLRPAVLTVLTSLGRTFFFFFFFFFLLAWRFILNENILFWLTLSYQKPFVFSASMLCFQIFTLILNLRPKIGLTYAISIVKWYFLYFCLSKYFYFSLLNLNYWCFTTILWKFSEKIEQVELVENLPQITYPTGFCIIFIHFYYGKKWKYLMF